MLELEYTASEPYSRFVFATMDQALLVRAYLFDRDLCEFSPPYLRVLRQDGRVVGMAALLTGSELVSSRLRAAFALTKSGLLNAAPEVAARIRSAGTTLMRPDASDMYLSRIATLPAARGQGLGRLMLTAVEREARARGCRRVALEVAPEGEAAAMLYRRQGFEQIDARVASDPAGGRRLEYLHMTKVVGAS